MSSYFINLEILGRIANGNTVTYEDKTVGEVAEEPMGICTECGCEKLLSDIKPDMVCRRCMDEFMRLR